MIDLVPAAPGSYAISFKAAPGWMHFEDEEPLALKLADLVPDVLHAQPIIAWECDFNVTPHRATCGSDNTGSHKAVLTQEGLVFGIDDRQVWPSLAAYISFCVRAK